MGCFKQGFLIVSVLFFISIGKIASANSSLYLSNEIDSINSDKFTIGGAIRTNYVWQNYNSVRKEKGGDFGFELFRLDFSGAYKPVYYSVQYRFYEYFNAIQHGYIGLNITPELNIEIGIHQVPFGILPYASHSFWFGATYYLGFEDDYDSGIKTLYKKNNWNIQTAFYKNSEYIDATRLGRYSFDLVTDSVQTNEEINQINLRTAYDFLASNGMVINIGASGEVGQIYNQTTRKNGVRQAYALHTDFKYHDWNIQLQGVYYNLRPENPSNIDNSTIQMGAFMYPFMVATEGEILTFNVAKTLKPGWQFIDEIHLYNDFSMVFPEGSNVHHSIQNVSGAMFVKKGIYLYIDWVTGQNMWFAGGQGIGLNDPKANEWKRRLNINFAYYF